MASTTAPLTTGNTAGTSTGTTAGTTSRPRERRLWRWAGGFGLAHVVVMLAGFASEGVSSVEHGDRAAAVLHAYRSVPTTRVELGCYLEAMSFLFLVAALVLLARLLARRTEAGRLAAQTALCVGVAYVAATFAIGFPPLTAAVYAAHRGVDAGALTTVNDLRNYGFVLQVALLMASVLALGVAALNERVMTRWAGYGGVALGAAGLVATPFAHDTMSMIWMVWWVGLALLCLKGGPRTERLESSVEVAADAPQ